MAPVLAVPRRSKLNPLVSVESPMITLATPVVLTLIAAFAGVPKLVVLAAGALLPERPKSPPSIGTKIPPAVLPSCSLIWAKSVSTDNSPAAPVKLLFCDVVPRLSCNCVGSYCLL